MQSYFAAMIAKRVRPVPIMTCMRDAYESKLESKKPAWDRADRYLSGATRSTIRWKTSRIRTLRITCFSQSLIGMRLIYTSHPSHIPARENSIRIYPKFTEYLSAYVWDQARKTTAVDVIQNALVVARVKSSITLLSRVWPRAFIDFSILTILIFTYITKK